MLSRLVTACLEREGARAMPRLTSVQRQFDQGDLILPNVRPASASVRAWTVLVRHVRERVPYAVLATEWQVSAHVIRQLAERGAEALQYPELADLPPHVRHALLAGGYTTREAVARVSDAELLALYGLGEARLRQLRCIIPRGQ